MKQLPAFASIRFSVLICLILVCTNPLNAQTIIPVETNHLAMILQAGKKGDLNIIYFGKKLDDGSEYAGVSDQYAQSEDYTHILNAAYTPSGTRNLAEPAITVIHADGNHSLDLKYLSHQVKKISGDITLLTVLLKDPVYDFEVRLFYKSY